MSIWATLFGSGNNPNNLQQQQVPANPPQPANPPADPPAPMAEFKTLWNPIENDPTKAGIVPVLEVDRVKEAASKADFSGQFDPAKISQVLSGGDNAAAALADLLNQATKAAYQASTAASATLNIHALDNASKNFEKVLPNHIRSNLAAQEISGANLAFADPAIQPLVNSVKQQMETRFPDASSADISSMTQRYLQETAKMILPQQTPATSQGKTNPSKDVDWADWLK